MARIGDLPYDDSIQQSGHLIYTEDGIHAQKISIEDFANAMDILMTQEVEGGEVIDGGGLKLWQEYKDSNDHIFLLGQSKDEKLADADFDSPSRDNWNSKYQHDNWDNENITPNFPGKIEIKTANDDIYPYVAFGMVHELGTSLSDFTVVDGDVRKILSENIGKFRLTIFIFEVGGTFDHSIYPWDGEGASKYTRNSDRDWVHYSVTSAFAGIAYDVNELFDSYDDAVAWLSDEFMNNTGSTFEMAGYFRVGQNMSTLYPYLSNEDYPDSDTYTYIDSAPDTLSIDYSKDGVNYSSYSDLGDDPSGDPLATEWSKLLLDLIDCTIRGGYTAYSDLGIFFGIPFNRSQYDTTEFTLDLTQARVSITPNGIIYNTAVFNKDIIKTNPLDDTYTYADWVKSYIDQQLDVSGFLTEVVIGDLSIVDEETNIAHINLGTGLRLIPDTIGQNTIYKLGIDPSELQPVLTPGTGVSIANDVITFEGTVVDIKVDGTSVVSGSGVANIVLPDSIKETKLQDGNHTEANLVNETSSYREYQIDLVDLSNDIQDDEDTVTIAPGSSAVLASIQVPNASSGGTVFGHANVKTTSGAITDSDYVSAVIRAGSNAFPSDDLMYQMPMVDSKSVIKPYTVSGTTYYPLTALRINGAVTEFGTTYYFMVKNNSANSIQVYGKLTFIENIDI